MLPPHTKWVVFSSRRTWSAYSRRASQGSSADDVEVLEDLAQASRASPQAEQLPPDPHDYSALPARWRGTLVRLVSNMPTMTDVPEMPVESMVRIARVTLTVMPIIAAQSSRHTPCAVRPLWCRLPACLEVGPMFQQAGRPHHKKSQPLRVPSARSLFNRQRRKLSGTALAAGGPRFRSPNRLRVRPSSPPPMRTNAQGTLDPCTTGG